MEKNGNNIMANIIPVSCALGRTCCIKYDLDLFEAFNSL